jgi:hypothetical protein
LSSGIVFIAHQRLISANLQNEYSNIFKNVSGTDSYSNSDQDPDLKPK